MRPREALLLATSVAISVVLSSALTLAWAGPTASPPNGNADAPINVGATTQFKNGNIGLYGNILLAASGGSYLNFGATSGSSGYGIRDNNGTLEFKSTGGTWNNFTNTVLNVLGIGAVSQIKFADGTTQTTAAVHNATFKYCTNAQTAGSDADCVAAGTSGYGTSAVRAISCLSAPPYSHYTASVLSWDGTAHAWDYATGASGWYPCLDGSVLIIKL